MSTGCYILDAKVGRRSDGKWLGAVKLQTPKGVRCVVAQADEDVIRRALQGDASAQLELHEQGAASAGIFDDIGKAITRPFKHAARAAKAVARGDMKAAMRHGVTSVIAQSPVGRLPGQAKWQEKMLRKGAPIASQYAPAAAMIPGVGPVAAGQITSATRLLARGYQGDPRAAKAIQQIHQVAATGTGKAREQARKMKAVLDGANHMLHQTGEVNRIKHEPQKWIPKHQRQVKMSPAQLRMLARQRGAAAGAWWDEWRPRFGIRPEAEALTVRQAYRSGVDLLGGL